jgi:sarcosine oxidase subunit gamma
MTPRGKGCEDKMGYQATIKKQGLLAIFDIKGRCQRSRKTAITAWLFSCRKTKIWQLKRNGQHLCWIGETHWLLLAPAEKEAQLLDSLAPHDPALDCRIVLVSDAYSFFSVRGNQADDILAIASPLDIRRINFPNNAASYTELFGIRGLVLRRQNGYSIAVERSYADMVSVYFDKVLTGKG